MSKERPIIFSGPMVRAILDGRKSMTRRVVHRLRRFGVVTEFGPSDTKGYAWHFRDKRMHWNDLRNEELLTYLPYTVGQQLWVRESFYLTDNGDEQCAVYAADERAVAMHMNFIGQVAGTLGLGEDWVKPHVRLRSPIHMPRWASRITLEVTDVRVQRLQDITEADAKAEGALLPWTGTAGTQDDDTRTALSEFEALWASINSPAAWQANPWVAAYTFMRVE